LNKKIGIYSSLFTFFAILSFSICMFLGILLKNDFIFRHGSYLTSIFIALGFIPMICTYLVYTNIEYKSLGYIALSFSIIYALLIFIVYYTQLTTLRLSKLSEEIIGILDYSKFGLFFNFNLLGYGFMSLSTFFIGIKFETKNKQEKVLRYLLCIHGVFFISCFIMPLLGVFNVNMAGKVGDIIGFIILQFWCLYFMPICVLSYKYFKNK